MNCKACNSPFEPSSAADRFCSDLCRIEFNAALGKMNRDNSKEPKPDFLFQPILKRKGKFLISHKSLDEIYQTKLVQFEMLLASQELKVVRLDNDYSVIKKSIL